MKETVACPLPGVALTDVGAFGAAGGVVAVVVLDAGPVPTAFVAVAENVYVVFGAKPVTVHGDDVHVAVVVAPVGDVAVTV